MKALGFIFPLLLAAFGYWIITYTNDSTPVRDHFDRRAFKKQKAAYLKAHPLHSGSEPIVWTCSCGHSDNDHTRKGCRAALSKSYDCSCNLAPREVRDRF